MPNRIIRDAMLDSTRYHAVDIRARLGFLEILLNADDYGLIPLSDVYLKRHCTAFEGMTSAAIDTLLVSLMDVDLLRIYAHEGARYAFIPRFGNNPRAAKPKWPAPPQEISGNQINDLASKLRSKRIADAQHLRANAPETETETETETDLRDSALSGTSPQAALAGHGLAVAASKIKKPAFPTCPHKLILDLWAEVMPDQHQNDPELWEGARATNLRARWKSTAVLKEWKSVDDGMTYFRKLFLYCRKSRFLMGNVPPKDRDGTPFSIRLDWLVKAANWVKVIEGNYNQD